MNARRAFSNNLISMEICFKSLTYQAYKIKFDIKNMMKLIFMIFFQFENNPRHPSLSEESKVHPGKAQQ